MDELKTFVTSFDKVMQQYILSLLSDSKRHTLERLMSYDEETVASIMTTEFKTIKDSMSIKEATSHVITTSAENDFIDELFVVSANNEFIGTVSLKDLISARESTPLESITYKTKVILDIDDSLDKGFRTFREYGKNVLPVVDNNHLVGIITADDIFNEMIDDNEENIERLVAVGDYDDESHPVVRAKQRLPWLLLSVLLNLVIAFVLDIFEATLDQVIALILFQPMILGMAGNIGTQSIAVTILKLNNNDLEKKKDLQTHILKELGIGLVNSIIIGILGFVIAFAVLSLISVGSQSAISLAFVIGSSLFGGMFISAIAGLFIPLILTRLKIDPAVASGPIISTVNDFFALVIYFGIATIMFIL